jgi:hypothetical protein
MTHTDHHESHGVVEATPRLLYGLNDKPPFKDSLFVPEALEHFPPAVKSILESGIATGAISALILNIVMPRPKEEALAAAEEPIAAESTVPMQRNSE